MWDLTHGDCWETLRTLGTDGSAEGAPTGTWHYRAMVNVEGRGSVPVYSEGSSLEEMACGALHQLRREGYPVP